MQEYRSEIMDIIERHLPDDDLYSIRDSILALGPITDEGQKVLDEIKIVICNHHMPGYMPDGDSFCRLEDETDPVLAFKARKESLKGDVKTYYGDTESISDDEYAAMIAEIDAYDPDDKEVDLTYYGYDGHVFTAVRMALPEFMSLNGADLAAKSGFVPQ